MEGDDPYQWTVAQVCSFFRNDAQALLNQLPNKPTLPALAGFLEALNNNDVSGFVLLTSVGTSDLRDEFGVQSFGHRSSLLYCIKKLRDRSRALNGHDEQEALQQSPIRKSIPDVPNPEPPSSKTLDSEQLSQPAIDELEKRPRKKRRLNPADMVTTAPEVTPTDCEAGYFGPGSIPVDALFYGETQLGKEIGFPKSAELTILDTDRVKDSTEHNFQFHSLQKLAGEAQYVYQQTRTFLQQDPIDIVRRGRPALALMPYREQLSQVANKVHSAMVVQYSDDSGDPVAVRENAAYLDNGGDYNGIAQDSTLGQYDYLTEKYGRGEDDVSDDESISSAGFERLQADIDAEWADEKAEIAASQAKDLSPADIENIVDETIGDFIQQWNTSKRPRKEETQAWSVWKLMKRSKSRRSSLIQDAQAKIEHYSSRLRGHKTNVLIADCRTRDEVVKLCAALEATVSDREEQKWRIDVWQRKTEPDHVVRHGRQSGGRTTAPAGSTNPSFVPHPDDRLSVEPGIAPATAEHEDIFVTPQGSPTPGLTEVIDEDEGFDGSDEASKHDDFVEDDDQFLGDLPFEDATTSSPADDEVTPGTPPSVHDSDGQRALSPSPSPTPSASTSDSADQLAPIESFFSQKKRKTPKNTPKKTSFAIPSAPASASRAKPTGVIEISSDSASSPPSGGIKGVHSNKRPYSSQNIASDPIPENASAYEVDAWQIADLLSRRDRKRIIIKLLRDLGTPALFAIKSLWVKRTLVGIKKDVLELLGKLRSHLETSIVQAGPLLQCARLALVWTCLKPEIMQGKYPQSIDWTAVERDFKLFIPFFSVLMQKSDSKLFNEHEHEDSPSPTLAPSRFNESDIIEIDSDSPLETPHSKRKRKVKYSAKAAESQNIARARHELYQAAETRSSNSQQLLAMVGSSNPSVPIDLLRLTEDQGAHFIHPAIAPKMKEHQLKGVRFMWRELTAGANTDVEGQGCVLAHAMGLGKTMQAITVLVAVTEAAQSQDPRISNQLPKNLRSADVAHKERLLRILVLCPPTLLENWRCEINQWAKGTLGDVFTIDAASKGNQMNILREWHDFGGVLLMGYSLFNKRVNRAKAEKKAGEVDKNGDKLDEYLLSGPEILVADEAHNVKNITAGVSMSVNRIETACRIALTGTPMSNDVGEMYSLISFAAPGFLGQPVEFKAKFGEPIEQGTYADSTSYEQRRSKVKLATLSRLIQPKIDRADITALKGSLQPKVEFVVTLPLTDLQRSVYNKYLDALLGGGKNDKASQVQIFSWLSLLTLLTNHPLAFKRKLNESKKPRKQKTMKLADALANAEGGAASPVAVAVDDESAEGVDYEETALRTLDFSEEIVKQITADIDDSIAPSLSAKMDVLMHILSLSRKCGDKVLVFSSSIPTLDYVGSLLRQNNIAFGRICGAVPAPKRPKVIDDFTNGLTSVLLISTRAGGVGLNIQAANRVVILDFGFNPAHEEQAIGRAYRFGQPKPVFVYRLICGGTFEDNIYNKQLFKTSLTQRVVDKKNPRRNAARSTRQYLYEPNYVDQQDLEEWVGKDPDVFDQLLKSQLKHQQGLVRKLTTIETLQREGDDPPLDAEELRQAEEEYQTSIAASMGARGQVANMESVPAFVAAQARKPPTLILKNTPRVRSTQPVEPPTRLFARLPGEMRLPASGPDRVASSMPNTSTRESPRGPLHGLPVPRSPPR